MYVESYVIHKAFADMFLEHGLLGFLVIGNSVYGILTFSSVRLGGPRYINALSRIIKNCLSCHSL